MDSDQKLLKGIASRDPEAFRTLMERHATFIINLAFRFLGTIADAEDVAQDVLFRLYQQPPRLTPNTRLSTWLYRVTANRCIDFLRKQSRGGTPISLDAPLNAEEDSLLFGESLRDPSAASPREQVAQAESARAIRHAVEALPELLRIPLVLSTFEELPHSEIAEILRTSPKAVERRIARARELLKVRLAPYL